MSSPPWLALDAKHCWHPYTQHGLEPEPLPVVAAEGAWLELADGRRMLDAISSWWTILHGHCHPRLVAALRDQAARLDHVLYAGCSHPPAARLAARLVELARRLPAEDGGLTRVFYSDDGSTAVEVALKACFLQWVRRGEKQRQRFVALEGGYHGDTFGAMAVGEPAPFFAQFAPLMFGVDRVPAEAGALEACFERLGERCAGFILEPLVQGAEGMIMHGADFLRDARSLCDRYGVPLLADEVMTGFGRTGTVFACEQAGICPDFLCLAKGLTGGMLPLAVTLMKEETYARFVSDQRSHAFFHGHSFTAHALGCAVALASLDLLEEQDTPARLAAQGARILAGLKPLRERPEVRELRRLGGIVAVEIASAEDGYLSGFGEVLRASCRAQEDVLLRPLGNVMYTLPPACLDDADCDRVAAALCAVVERALASARP